MNSTKPRFTFFFQYSLLLLLIAISGFGINALVNTDRIPQLSPILIIHIIAMYSWYIFVVVQSSLVKSKLYALHRKLGLLSIFLATALVLTGVMTTVNLHLRIPEDLASLTYNSFVLTMFSLLYGLAIYKRHSSDSHKRLILFSSLAVLHPALFRFDLIFQANVSFGLLLLLLLLIVVYDIRVLKKVHTSTIFGSLVLVAFFATAVGLILSEDWNDFLRSLLN